MIPEFSIAIKKNTALSLVTRELVFTAPKDFSFKAGQYVMIKVPFTHPAMGASTKVKQYSIASSPDQLPQLSLCIKRIGPSSEYLCNLQEGALVMQGPAGHFTLEEGKHHAVFLAAGTGIAPIHSIILYGLKHDFFHSCTLIQGARTTEGLLYREEFEKLAIQYYPVMSREGQKMYVQELLQDLAKEELIDVKRSHVYACGLAPMVEACKVVGMTLGAQKLHFERFN